MSVAFDTRLRGTPRRTPRRAVVLSRIAVVLLGIAGIAAGIVYLGMQQPLPVDPVPPRAITSILDRYTLKAVAARAGIAPMEVQRDAGLMAAVVRSAAPTAVGAQDASLSFTQIGATVVGAYRTLARAGQRITVVVDDQSPNGAGSSSNQVAEQRAVVVDLFRSTLSSHGVEYDYHWQSQTVAPGATATWMADRDSMYTAVVSQEASGMLIGARVDVGASYAFPVAGTDAGDIWSVFGDPRDGGRRIHHGIDIFAPRGTPVLAATDAVVIRTGRRTRGGVVVVLYDDLHNLLLYYAHLDRYSVERGERVVRGQAIGTVGNTGNAVTTPPHLHLGLYAGWWSRPVDPWWYFVSE